MNNDYRSGRPLQGLLTLIVAGALAIAVGAYAYYGFIAPAFAKINATFEQVHGATEAR